jgi:hypothetical protein
VEPVDGSPEAVVGPAPHALAERVLPAAQPQQRRQRY